MFVSSLLRTHTLWVESVKASDKTIEGKIKNCIRARTQTYFTPLPTSNDSTSSPFKLTDAFIIVYKADMNLTNDVYAAN